MDAASGSRRVWAVRRKSREVYSQNSSAAIAKSQGLTIANQERGDPDQIGPSIEQPTT
jgi:hypothetical protein